MGYEQRTFPDTQSCRIYFCCFPLALENIRPWPLACHSHKFLWKTVNSKSPTVPFGIVVCTFSDNLSWNSYMYNHVHVVLSFESVDKILLWPFKCIPSGSNFTWCYLFFSILHVEIMLNNDFWPWVIIQAFTIIIVMYATVFNESRWPAKLAGYFTKTSLLLFFGNFPSLSSWVLTSCHWIKVKKPKFSDVCFLSKHSNFCSRMLEMHCKRPRLQFFFFRNLHLCHEFFLSPPKLLPPT